jgi:crossover junction endodeoxyribonuclease RuvC
MTSDSIRILGIDPGLRNTGWGIIEARGSRLSFVACGRVCADSSATMGLRLRQLHEGLTRVICDHAPHEAAVEETFVNRDPQSALK